MCSNSAADLEFRDEFVIWFRDIDRVAENEIGTETISGAQKHTIAIENRRKEKATEAKVKLLITGHLRGGILDLLELKMEKFVMVRILKKMGVIVNIEETDHLVRFAIQDVLLRAN